MKILTCIYHESAENVVLLFSTLIKQVLQATANLTSRSLQTMHCLKLLITIPWLSPPKNDLHFWAQFVR